MSRLSETGEPSWWQRPQSSGMFMTAVGESGSEAGRISWRAVAVDAGRRQLVAARRRLAVQAAPLVRACAGVTGRAASAAARAPADLVGAVAVGTARCPARVGGNAAVTGTDQRLGLVVVAVAAGDGGQIVLVGDVLEVLMAVDAVEVAVDRGGERRRVDVHRDLAAVALAGQVGVLVAEEAVFGVLGRRGAGESQGSKGHCDSGQGQR